MDRFKECKKELVEEIENIHYEGDIGDFGNHIGIIIAKYFDEFNDKDSFISGLEHGISLTDGTHG
jgi:hypothetical protein